VSKEEAALQEKRIQDAREKRISRSTENFVKAIDSGGRIFAVSVKGGNVEVIVQELADLETLKVCEMIMNHITRKITEKPKLVIPGKRM